MPDSDPNFAYLCVHTPLGHGGPGGAEDFAARASELGLTSLACSDYGSVGAWPQFDSTLRRRGIRPIFGLALDIRLGGEFATGANDDGFQPALLLAANGQGLRNLVWLHNRLAREAGGRCWCSLEDVASHLPGAWLVLLAEGEYEPAPLAALPRKQALALVSHVAAAAPSPEIVLLGLPPGAEQAHFAELAAAARMPAVALPMVRYPDGDAQDAHVALHPHGAWSREAVQGLAALDAVATRYAAYPGALELAGRVAESCRVGDDLTQTSLAPLRSLSSAADLEAELRRVAAEAAAAHGLAAGHEVEVEIEALRGLRLTGEMLAAHQAATSARSLGIYLGRSSGAAAAGALAALLGLAPANPFGVPPAWLSNGARREALLPGLAVAACARAGLARRLAAGASALVPAGGERHLSFTAALRLAGQARGVDPGIIADLTRLASGEPGGAAAVSEAHAEGRLSGDKFDLPGLLDLAGQLAGCPAGPAPDAELLAALSRGAALPIVPVDGAQAPGCSWPASTIELLATPLLQLSGYPDLDIIQRALELVDHAPAEADADAMRLLITSGDTAGLPLPALDLGAGESSAPGVLAADAAALVPDDPRDEQGWAILGALLCGPRGPHPWLQTYIRRRIGQAPFPASHRAVDAILESTCGLPLFAEQIAAAELRLAQPEATTAAEGLRLRAWLGESGQHASSYGDALAAGRLLGMALRLKAGHPAAFLAAAMEHARREGDAGAMQELILEAQQRSIALLPPDIRFSGVGFSLEEAPSVTLSRPDAGRAGHGSKAVREAPVGPHWNIRWGLALTPRVEQAARELEAARRRTAASFSSLADLCTELNLDVVTHDALEQLIRAGALDYLGPRAMLLLQLAPAIRQARREQRQRLARQAGGPSQLDLFEADTAAVAPGGEGSMAGAEATDQVEDAEIASPGPENAGPAGEPRTWEAALLGHVFAPHPAVNALLSGAGHQAGIARHSVASVTLSDAGNTVSVPVVLSAVDLIPAGSSPQAKGERIAVAWVEDGTGRLPLLIFPHIYARHKALALPGTAVILTARVRLAELWEGAGSQVVLVCEHMAPYEVERRAHEIDVTPIKRGRAPTAAARAGADKNKSSGAPQPAAVPREAMPVPVAPPPAAPGSPGAGRAPAPTPDSSAAALPPGLAGQGPSVVLTLPVIPSEEEDEQRMRRLKAILTRYPGDSSVILYFPDDPSIGMPTHMPLRSIKVNPSDQFCAEVGELLGGECVRVLSTSTEY